MDIQGCGLGHMMLTQKAVEAMAQMKGYEEGVSVHHSNGARVRHMHWAGAYRKMLGQFLLSL